MSSSLLLSINNFFPELKTLYPENAFQTHWSFIKFNLRFLLSFSFREHDISDTQDSV